MATTGGGNRRGRRAQFGSVRKLPSGRFQARYTGPDSRVHRAPTTFETKGDAAKWLDLRSSEITRGKWLAPSADEQAAFAAYATSWLAGRDLKPRTRAHYRSLLENQIGPTFDNGAVSAITAPAVRAWYAGLDASKPTLRSHAYGLLRSILGTAVTDGLLPANPCHIRGAGTTKRVHKVEPARLGELEVIVNEMPDRYKLMALFAAWCGLRFGELAELRRKDVDVKGGVLHIRRGVVRVDGEAVVGTPKSEAGIRDVAIPPHLLPLVRDHMSKHAEWGKEGLLFPATHGGQMNPSSLYRVYYPAREKAGRPDLRWHDLRHTGAVLAASTGATLAELMGRLGHSTPAAAMRYQHAAAGRDAEIAKALSVLADRQ